MSMPDSFHDRVARYEAERRGAPAIRQPGFLARFLIGLPGVPVGFALGFTTCAAAEAVLEAGRWNGGWIALSLILGLHAAIALALWAATRRERPLLRQAVRTTAMGYALAVAAVVLLVD